ncbi:ATP-binding cassette domain-containing protein [Agrococcus sp. SL85]|uniref:metal ABC transporter ATP-binding protein n=1 Tax=Agrococcus sp. SL85 TaxID=2995141 RepID=UPI00226C930D|nr:ATP-binding cassette domain-containing protein [Agrococcus sp. SL85]WAC67055.1 ATP-binding cassette domain-containing protein [Agrococcus sp. SL85]
MRTASDPVTTSAITTSADAASAAAAHDVAVRGLAVRRGGALALVDVTCTLRAGAVTAVVGGNGSGKSTLLEALAGLLPIAAGRIDGPPAARALVVQRSEADDRVPLRARQVVAMGLWRERGALGRLGREDRARILAALEEVGAADLADRQLASLSGGQRQRVLVAQGLVQRAPLLLLDEPAAAADAAARDRIDAALAAAAGRGAAVVVATHDRTSLARADRALLLDRGRVVVEGSPAAAAAAQAEARRGGARPREGVVRMRAGAVRDP